MTMKYEPYLALPNLTGEINVEINPNLKSIINLDAPVKPVYQPPTAKVAAPVPQSKPAVKTFEPAVRSSPTFAKSPTPSAPAPVAAQHQPQPATFDLSNPQASGVMRLPTVNFGSKGTNQNQDKKETIPEI